MEEKREAVRLLSRLKSETGEEISSELDLPADVTVNISVYCVAKMHLKLPCFKSALQMSCSLL
jgi:hypothetical protein